MNEVAARIASELTVAPAQINAAIALLDGGATVPFIARYRKELTGGLDDTQLRYLADRVVYLRELENRRETILSSLREQAKLTPDLEQAVKSVTTKAELEDLYLPFKPKRRTKAQIAREAGLAPLAQRLLDEADIRPEVAAADFVATERGVTDLQAALDGARQILMEQFAETAPLIAQLRTHLQEHAMLQSRVVPGQEVSGAKFTDYFDYEEPWKKVRGHRALALLRGRQEGILQLTLSADHVALGEHLVAGYFALRDQGRPADAWRLTTAKMAWKVKLFTHLEVELFQTLRERAESEAIQVFSANLKDLLLAAPAGRRPTLGIDPGIRTGIKVAAVDSTGKVLETATLYPHPPQNRWKDSLFALAELCSRHQIALIAIGNGTASRETDRLVAELLQEFPQLKATKALVSEAGASVYSASELASQELPDLDVSLRGAVSIARRLQDPLAELVKIDPKSIGVGQYQHDVSPLQLAKSLDGVVEDCVNAVGVDVNTASPALLTRIAGLNSGLAQQIVAYRNEQGAFKNRRELLKVPRLGPKTFEQSAGFLRIPEGEHPLDASAVHPEAYPLVERISAACNRPIKQLIGDQKLLQSLDPKNFIDDLFGLPTVRDVLQELNKPGRDPRPQFQTAHFDERIQTINDLQPGMILEGVVSNVANFGAFVDLGVHQDGLIHISLLSEQFVDDPRKVVKVGQVVRVKVMSVDVARKRIALSRRLDADPRDYLAERAAQPSSSPQRPRSSQAPQAPRSTTPVNSALSEALQQARNRKK